MLRALKDSYRIQLRYESFNGRNMFQQNSTLKDVLSWALETDTTNVLQNSTELTSAIIDGITLAGSGFHLV